MPFKTRDQLRELHQFAWIDDTEVYTELPIKFEEYTDFMTVCISGVICPAVLARRSERFYYCLQLRHLPDGHLLRAIFSNLCRINQRDEAEYCLSIIRLCFYSEPYRFGRMMNVLEEMIQHVPSHTETPTKLHQFLVKFKQADFSTSDDAILAVVSFCPQGSDLQHLYTSS